MKIHADVQAGFRRVRPWCPFGPCLWLLLGLLHLPAAAGQLAITEVMSSASTRFGTNIVAGGPDYWELTNFGAEDVDLTGYRFNDNQGNFIQAYAECFADVTIKAGESIVFFENDMFSPDDFRFWWNLGPDVRLFWYPSTGYGLSPNGDAIILWGPSPATEEDVVDKCEFGQATPGVSFTYDSRTGEWGIPSVAGIDYAFRAATADDIGSPGTHAGATPLRVVEQPVNREVNAMDDVTFQVRHWGLPRPTFQWFHGSQPIPGAHLPSLALSHVQPADAGPYFVVLSNYFQVVTSLTATLTVNLRPTPPGWVQVPTDAWIYVDQVGRFRAVATGVPQPALQWRRDGVEMPGETAQDLVLAGPHEIGTNEFTLVASNASGTNIIAAKLLVFARPDLRITELMAREKPWPNRHEDWWELTNFGTNAVDLFGYRFDDFTEISGSLTMPRLEYAWVLTNHVIIQPGESIVFVERLSAEDFRRWWGSANLRPDLQIISYTGGGMSFSESMSDGLALWNMGATFEDDVVTYPYLEYTRVSYSSLDLPFVQGVSFTIDPDLPEDYCCYLKSVPLVYGAFVAAEGGDVGSPGYIRTPTDPRVLAFRREPTGWRLTWRSGLPGNYRVERRENLTTGNWTVLTNVSQAGPSTSYLDTSAPPAGQRFYRIVYNP